MAQDVVTGQWHLGRIQDGFLSYTGKYRIFVRAFGLWTRTLDMAQVRKAEKEELQAYAERRKNES